MLKMIRSPEIAGQCSPEFYRVRDVFYRSLKSGHELGAGVCVYVDGEKALDLWSGWTNLLRTRDWQADTLTNIFSCTKGLAALCALRLVDQGELGLDMPVAEYWPGFGQKGKEAITLRTVLGHRAGLPAVRAMLSAPAAVSDPTIIERHLERSRPWWAPGSTHGYHALSLGWLLGKIVRTVSGKTLGQYFADEIAGPLGLDIHIGTAAEHHARISRPIYNTALLEPHRDIAALIKGIARDSQAMTLRAFANPLPLGLHAALQTSTWARIEQPAGNGMATARDLARLYSILANGGISDTGYVLLSEKTLALCWQEQSIGPDLVLKRSTRFSHGFMLGQPGRLSSYGPGPRSFGHNGLGGTLTVADPDHRIGFGFVTNRIGNYVLVDPRPRALLDAVYECL